MSPDIHRGARPDGPPALRAFFLPLADKTGGPIAPTRSAPPAGQWFDLDVVAAGPVVRVLVNGHETSRAERRPPGPGGRIALQAFGGTTEVEFASIAVKELPAGKAPE